jgi:DNA-binding response OmpR family regulator
MKILVVDDDALVRMIVTAGLKQLKHDVVACETGKQAWEILRTADFPIMITDWSMPEMDGLELTEHLRKTPRESYTYVIMLTGHGSREDYLRGVKAGVDAFLVKPLDGAMLEAQLNIATRIVGLQNHAKRLESIMTVCSYCKRVRNATEWVDMEQYVAKELKTAPSHTFCPTCFHDKVEPEMKALGLSTDDLGIR